MAPEPITVLLADDNVIVREGVRALLAGEPDIVVVGVAGDYDTILADAARLAPRVLVTDVRMPPSFQREGVDAAREVRLSRPGTGVVVLSQYDDPEYAISLLGEGTEGLAYLLKDRVADSDQLARAVRTVAAGGSMLDPSIVEALVQPVAATGELSAGEEELLRLVAEGRSIKAIAAARRTTPAAAAEEVEELFLAVARSATAGSGRSLRKLRLLHDAIVEREEQGESLRRLLPAGLSDALRRVGRPLGSAETLEVTVLISDVRGYSAISEDSDSSVLASQLNAHRAAMSRVVHGAGGTLMQFVGDAVFAVFGAPLPLEDHADRALAAAVGMQAEQAALNERWRADGLPEFPLGVGLSTGSVAAALLGSDDRHEYTVVGTTVNLAQRLQAWAKGGQIILSIATREALREPVEAEAIEPAPVKGYREPIGCFRIDAVRGVSGPSR